ncbi:acyl-CoA thioesterase [Pacificoceanicola onchidii]|uniref:acyl-CoA thioesterase n=1 Tax=Pacificoceanicola onchidii TaxID=2562685 RepID=UPI0010A69CB8|nr:acyl-CoA thioesterase [Pacificoceanicola onchidii]
MSRLPAGTRADYRAFVPLQTRWADNDEYGHMNNAAYLSLIDTAVSLWKIGQGIEIRGPGAHRFVVVETGLRFHAELGFPDPVNAGIRISHLGRSSVRFEVGLFPGDVDQAHAEGFFAMVLTGPDGKPLAMSQRLRGVFEGIAVV